MGQLQPPPYRFADGDLGALAYSHSTTIGREQCGTVEEI
jgi:hypothetical protein